MTKTYTKDTLTREVLERGVKLRVIDEQHSRAFQRACFDLKVFWPQGEVVQYTGMPFLFVGLFRGKHSLKYSSVLDVFDSQPETEIYFYDEKESPPSDDPQEGVSLRDYFAGRALQGSLASPANEGMTPEHLAEWSYTVADAMLKARKE